jgi:hypothetical protein
MAKVEELVWSITVPKEDFIGFCKSPTDWFVKYPILMLYNLDLFTLKDLLNLSVKGLFELYGIKSFLTNTQNESISIDPQLFNDGINVTEPEFRGNLLQAVSQMKNPHEGISFEEITDRLNFILNRDERASISNKDKRAAIEIFNKIQYRESPDVHLHLYYTKNLTNKDEVILTGSSGSSIIMVACPHPGEQRELYDVSSNNVLTVKNFYQKHLDAIKGRLLTISANGKPIKKSVFKYSPNSSIGFLHFDTKDESGDTKPDNDGTTKSDAQKTAFLELLLNPWLLVELCNQLNVDGHIETQFTSEIRDSNNNIELSPPESVPAPVGIQVIGHGTTFTLTNGVESFQATTTLSSGGCPNNYQYVFCYKTGFTINGSNASAVIANGSGWCASLADGGAMIRPKPRWSDIAVQMSMAPDRKFDLHVRDLTKADESAGNTIVLPGEGKGSEVESAIRAGQGRG